MLRATSPTWSITLVAGLVAACGGDHRATEHSPARAPRPDELPSLVSGELPFKYPPSLYARRVQGNVMLKLFIDRDGRVVSDSTRIDRASGYAELDSAAVAGAPELRFVPAKLGGEPIGTTVLFPLFFRHPEAQPLPGDSILKSEKSG
ncbi:MAG: energy transducer TonB [Gemmatimonadaceae bacterium]